MRPSVQTFPFPPASDAPFVLALANASDRAEIFRVRHDVYARELGQHAVNHTGTLSDRLDDSNHYLVARCRGAVAGFVSITPAGAPSFSIDKYFSRTALPFDFDDRLHEVRLLTVRPSHRGRELATLLMYAAYRWVEAHGGTRIVGIGRREVMDLYQRVGLQPMGLSTRSGSVTFDLVLGRIEDLREVARVVGDRKVHDGVSAMIVPGSGLVKEQAEAEGLDRIFKAAGFEWREPGCSMCLGMNPDRVAPGKRCASTSNRNFEGRQGRDARTHLVSPAMAAAAAITGRLTDVRQLEIGRAHV